MHGTFVCDGGAISVPALVDLVIEETKADAAALGCSAELNVAAPSLALAPLRTRNRVFHAHGRTGGRAAALQAVTRWLAAATLE